MANLKGGSTAGGSIILTQKDEGSGNGIDADMLDSYHESSFFKLADNETVAGIPAFNGGATGSTAPFTVDSTYKVTNLNADLLDNFHANTAAGNSTIVARNASGYIYANYFNTTPNTVTSGVTQVCVETGDDGFIRHGTQAAIRTFIGAGSGNGLDADLLDGNEAAYFSASTHNHDAAYLGITAKAADSDKLDNHDSTYFSIDGHNHDAAYLGITAKAADSDKLDNHDSTYFSISTHNHDATYLKLIGGTLTGDLTAGATTRNANSYIRVLSNDTHIAGFEAYGASQGTGYCFVGQGATYGGGMFYNGDGSPAFATGETADYVSFYRMTAGAKTVVFDYLHSDSTVRFKSGLNIQGGQTIGKLTISTSAPSGGADNDLWFVREA